MNDYMTISVSNSTFSEDGFYLEYTISPLMVDLIRCAMETYGDGVAPIEPIMFVEGVKEGPVYQYSMYCTIFGMDDSISCCSGEVKIGDNASEESIKEKFIRVLFENLQTGVWKSVLSIWYDIAGITYGVPDDYNY